MATLSAINSGELIDRDEGMRDTSRGEHDGITVNADATFIKCRQNEKRNRRKVCVVTCGL